MKPEGRKHYKFPSKTDCHPKKGYMNWWEDGAYNQLRGKYEVTYVINKDSCVVDTIININ